MEDTRAHNFLNQQNPNNPEINKIIPVVKLVKKIIII